MGCVDAFWAGSVVWKELSWWKKGQKGRRKKEEMTVQCDGAGLVLLGKQRGAHVIPRVVNLTQNSNKLGAPQS